MDIDMVEKVTVKKLTLYLRLKALKLWGNEKELVARVWSAMEMGTEIQLTAAEVEAELKTEYADQLTM